jgi:hypothetical protein
MSVSIDSPSASPSLTSKRTRSPGRTLRDGHQALLINGGGFDGGDGAYFANAGQDVHAVREPGPVGGGLVCSSFVKATPKWTRSLQNRGSDRVPPNWKSPFAPRACPGRPRRKPRTPRTSA